MSSLPNNIFGFSATPQNTFSPEFFEMLRDNQAHLNGLGVNPLLVPDVVRMLIAQRMNQIIMNNVNTNGSASVANVDQKPEIKYNPKKRSSPPKSSVSPKCLVERKPRKRNRIGGSSVKTAEVWRFFVQIPDEQAAQCMICSKTIKATNSSTTGMIRHLRSCHSVEHEILQKARRQNFLRKGLKNGILDENQLKEIAYLQQLDQDQENLGNITQRVKTEVTNSAETVAASTSSNIRNGNVTHSVEQLIATSTNNTVPKTEPVEGGSDSGSPVVRTKRGRPPKITSDEPAWEAVNHPNNKIYHELAVLFSCGVLPITTLDNVLFRNFLIKVVPGIRLFSSEEFQKMVPFLVNGSTTTNLPAFLANNPNVNISPPRSSNSSVSSERKDASPAPTTESGFHEEDDQAPSDEVSIPGSFITDILNLCVSRTTNCSDSQNLASESTTRESFAVETSSFCNEAFLTLFNELIDYIGQDIFPRVSLYNLLLRLYNVYLTVKGSSYLVKEIFSNMNLSSVVDLDTAVTSRIADDSGIDINDLLDKSAALPQLINCLNFGIIAFHDINNAVKNGLISGTTEFGLEDYELLTAVQHHITNPDA